MKTIAAIMICAVAAFFASTSFDTPAEAKKYKPPKVAKKVGKSVGRAARNTGKTIGSATRWGVNGIWVSTGLGAGHAALTNSCTYYYKRYKETRNAKWRNKYNACIR